MNLTVEAVNQALTQIKDKHSGDDIVGSKAVRNIEIDRGQVNISVELGYPAKNYVGVLREQIEQCISALPGVVAVEAEVSYKIIAHAVQQNLKPLPGVRNIIAVASGKGGVGKSTTAVNLALALASEGARVGILDADIYGPSQPQMLGIGEQQPVSEDGQKMQPLRAHGLQAMSIGFLVDVETPMVWRGPMASQALNQLLNDTLWQDLDYLVVDMPPGTGDIQLTLSQKIPVTGALMITTPQDIALLDARKGLKMFEKVGVPILGVVENMSMHICSNCAHEEPIFGTGGGEKMCRDYDIPFLGALPLHRTICDQTDHGTPTVVAEPNGTIAEHYREIARKVAVAVARKARDMTHKFPKIVIQNT